MTVSSLFLAGCFTLAVEGSLPADPGIDPLFRLPLIEVIKKLQLQAAVYTCPFGMTLTRTLKFV